MQVAGICTKPGQFSQPCRLGGGGYANASRLLSGRCKKIFEFASQRLKTGKTLAHPKPHMLRPQNIVVRRNMVRSGDGVKGEQGLDRDRGLRAPDLTADVVSPR